MILAGAAIGMRNVSAQNVVEVTTVDVGMVYIHAWDTHGPGLEARLGFSIPGRWLGLQHEVALAAQVATTHGTVAAIGQYDRTFRSGGVVWRSTFPVFTQSVKPYVLVPVFLARSGLELGEEYDRAYLSSTMLYRDLPDPYHVGTHWGACVGMGGGMELDVTRFLHFDVSGTLMYPTIFEDRTLIKTVRFGVAFGG
jgi:hypothetical protein